MAEIGIRQLKANASEIVSQVEAGKAYVVTKRGRPAAVLLPVEEAEDWVLANAEEYVQLRRQARREYEQGRTTDLDDIP